MCSQPQEEDAHLSRPITQAALICLTVIRPRSPERAAEVERVCAPLVYTSFSKGFSDRR